MTEERKLTICSVYHSLAAKRLLELNYEFTRTCNLHTDIRWIVADNTPADFSEKLETGEKFIIVPGAGEIGGVPKWMWGTCQHSRALKHAISEVTTRFAVILDMDFYIVIPEWMQAIPQYMIENNLAFFGVPWHPVHHRKWRYFPSPHTLFVDLHKINREELIFEPQYTAILHPSFLVRLKERMIKKILPKHLQGRLDINSFPDTGYPIYERFAEKMKYECPQPVFRASPSFVDRLLPDQFSFVPKRRDYFTTIGFRERGLPDCAGKRWEEFIWEGRPYGFHIRGSHKLQNSLEGDLCDIRTILHELHSRD